ncbi:MAG: hypothetical protein NUW02_02705 [Candidatus Campbellbacteria bacterium]|nr:hypothetical protein [Candidatus Campbellbacteria bacterium]
MSKKRNPRTPNGLAVFFGPSVSDGVEFLSENITSNGFMLFEEETTARRAVAERKEHFGKEFPTVRLVGMELHIAESRGEWKELRSFGSYVVAYGESFRECRLHGTPCVNGERVGSAHDSWASFNQNGCRPFTSFRCLIGEVGLGTIPELLRQGDGGGVFLIGIKILWHIQ